MVAKFIAVVFAALTCSFVILDLEGCGSSREGSALSGTEAKDAGPLPADYSSAACSKYFETTMDRPFWSGYKEMNYWFNSADRHAVDLTNYRIETCGACASKVAGIDPKASRPNSPSNSAAYGRHYQDCSDYYVKTTPPKPKAVEPINDGGASTVVTTSNVGMSSP